MNRYGVGGGNDYTKTPFVWWRDWERSWDFPPKPGQNKLWTLLHLKPGDDLYRPTLLNKWDAEMCQVERLIKSGYTGQYWEIGNECDWKPYVEPALYAELFNDYYNAIKSLDETATILSNGLALLAPGWRAWLNVADIHPDVWSIHPYSSPLNAQTTIDMIADFRCMYPERPVWITEFSTGSAYSTYGAEVVKKYMRGVCAWLDANAARLQIERWFWWGSWAAPAGMGENGIYSGGPYCDDTLTEVGQEYERLAKKHNIFIPMVMR